MPIHDWTRVSAGTWHDFHFSWVAALQEHLNSDGLPPDWYAQVARNVPALEGPENSELHFVVTEPQVRYAETAEMDAYAQMRRTIAIRHNSGDRIVALLELVSPGNKGSQGAIETFVEKAQESLYRGYHLLIVDLFPPGPRDPHGLHAVIWRGLSETAFELSPDEPLALLAYSAGPRKKAYIEPTRVGNDLIEMPLFLTPDTYINVPLETTYRAAYRGVPRKWKAVLDAPSR